MSKEEKFYVRVNLTHFVEVTFCPPHPFKDKVPYASVKRK